MTFCTELLTFVLNYKTARKKKTSPDLTWKPLHSKQQSFRLLCIDNTEQETLCKHIMMPLLSC